MDIGTCDYPPNPPYYGYYTAAGFPTAVCVGTEVDSSATQSPPPPPPPPPTHTPPHLLVLIQIVDANIPTA